MCSDFFFHIRSFSRVSVSCCSQNIRCRFMQQEASRAPAVLCVVTRKKLRVPPPPRGMLWYHHSISVTRANTSPSCVMYHLKCGHKCPHIPELCYVLPHMRPPVPPRLPAVMYYLNYDHKCLHRPELICASPPYFGHKRHGCVMYYLHFSSKCPYIPELCYVAIVHLG